MIFKLYWYFGVVGVASIVAWLCALFLLARFILSRRRTFFYARALCLALAAWLFASMNSHNVSLIQADRTQELHEAKQRQLDARAAEMKALKERAADIRFVEDDKYDYYDLAGVGGDEKKSIYELAAEGMDVEPLYRQSGKQRRAGWSVDDGQATDFSEDVDPDTVAPSRPVKILPERDRASATRLAVMNLRMASIVVVMALVLLIFDYFSLFNTTFNAVIPLPFSGRIMDRLFPKKRSVLLPSAQADLTLAYLETVLRKGECFLYFGPRSVLSDLNTFRVHIPFRRMGLNFVGLFRFAALLSAFARMRGLPVCRLAERSLSVWFETLCAMLVSRKLAACLSTVGSWASGLLNSVAQAVASVGRGLRGWFGSLPGRSIAGGVLSAWILRVGGLPVMDEVVAAVADWNSAFARTVRHLFSKVVVRNGALEMLPSRVLYLSSGQPPSSSEFVLESAWFNRYSFVIDDAGLASRIGCSLLEFLGDRCRPHAAAWKTVHVVWDKDAGEFKELDLDKLLFLAAEANFKLVLFAPEPDKSSLRDLFEEIGDAGMLQRR